MNGRPRTWRGPDVRGLGLTSLKWRLEEALTSGDSMTSWRQWSEDLKSPWRQGNQWRLDVSEVKISDSKRPWRPETWWRLDVSEVKTWRGPDVRGITDVLTSVKWRFQTRRDPDVRGLGDVLTSVKWRLEEALTSGESLTSWRQWSEDPDVEEALTSGDSMTSWHQWSEDLKSPWRQGNQWRPDVSEVKTSDLKRPWRQGNQWRLDVSEVKISDLKSPWRQGNQWRFDVSEVKISDSKRPWRQGNQWRLDVSEVKISDSKRPWRPGTWWRLDVSEVKTWRGPDVLTSVKWRPDVEEALTSGDSMTSWRQWSEDFKSPWRQGNQWRFDVSEVKTSEDSMTSWSEVKTWRWRGISDVSTSWRQFQTLRGPEARGISDALTSVKISDAKRPWRLGNQWRPDVSKVKTWLEKALTSGSDVEGPDVRWDSCRQWILRLVSETSSGGCLPEPWS